MEINKDVIVPFPYTQLHNQAAIGSIGYAVDGLANWSTQEFELGIWVNGKTLYKKVIPINPGEISDHTSGTFNLNIPVSNIDEVWVNIGESYMYHSGVLYHIPVNFYHTEGDWERVYTVGSTLVIEWGSVYNSINTKGYIITVYYTKN